MSKKLLVLIIWLVFGLVILGMYLFRENAVMKLVIAWALSIWPILTALFIGALALSGWIWRRELKNKSKKDEAIPQAKNTISDILSNMHNRSVELQDKKAKATYITFYELEKAMPTFSDRMGLIKLDDWPEFEEEVKQRIIDEVRVPKPKNKYAWTPKSFIERRSYIHDVERAGIVVASKIKQEQINRKNWTLKDCILISDWVDDMGWGIKILRDNDPQWKPSFESLQDYLKDKTLNKYITEHIEYSRFFNNVNLLVRYSARFPTNIYARILHGFLVGSPVSPATVSPAMAELLAKIDKRVSDLNDRR